MVPKFLCPEHLTTLKQKKQQNDKSQIMLNQLIASSNIQSVFDMTLTEHTNS